MDPVAPVVGPVRARLLGVDLTRCVAICCMAVAHSVPLMQVQSHTWGFVLRLLNDLASPTFALTMGLGLGLAVGRTGTAQDVARNNLLRGLLLVLLGIGLSGLDTWIAIVLQPLGLALALGSLTVLIRSRTGIGLLAVALAVAAPLLNRAAATVDRLPGPAWNLWQWLFLHPSYRVTNLLPLVVLGVWLTRGRLGSPRLQLTWVAAGTALWALGTTAGTALGGPLLGPRSGSWPDLACDLGLALTVFGLCGRWSTAARPTDPGARRWLRQVTLAAAAIGTNALSFYVVQVLVVFALEQFSPVPGSPLARFGVVLLVLVLPLATWGWARAVGRGPLEYLLAAVRVRPSGDPPTGR